MAGLQFTRDLALAILRGDKIQTLRATLPRGLIVDTRLTMMNGYHSATVFGHAIVTVFDLVTVSHLTTLDARLDGFATLADLRARLARMKVQHEQLWRIRWRDFRPTGTLKGT
jgi:hypothetical protein